MSATKAESGIDLFTAYIGFNHGPGLPGAQSPEEMVNQWISTVQCVIATEMAVTEHPGSMYF